MHHGTANAVLLPTVLGFNREAAAERLAEVARYLGIADVAARVIELNALCGIAPRLRDYAIPEDSLAMLASKAIQDGCHLSNPRACTEADLLMLYRAAW